MPDTKHFEMIRPRIKNSDKDATAIATMAMVFSIIVGIHSSSSTTNLEAEIRKLRDQLNALKVQLEETRSEILQYLNVIVLHSLANRIFSLQEEIRIWAETRDTLGVETSYGPGRSTYRELVAYLLEPPGFVSDESYVVLEELHLVQVSNLMAMDVILGRRSSADVGIEASILKVLKNAHEAQERLITRAIVPAKGEFTSHSEQGQTFYTEKHGYTEIDGTIRFVAQASAVFSGNNFLPWQRELDRVKTEVEVAIVRRRLELLSQAREPIREASHVALENVAILGDEVGEPL